MKPFFFAALLLLAVLFAGCSPAAPSPVAGVTPDLPTPIALEAGKGGLSGQVAEAASRWSGETVTAFAAPFTAVNGQEQGFYVLEPEVHPHTNLDASGRFQMGSVDPGTYVLVVGPSAREGALVMNGDGKPRVFTVKSGELLQTGPLTLAQ